MKSPITQRTVLTALVAFTCANAQPAKEFEAASVKPNSSDDHRVSIQISPGGVFTANGLTVRIFMQQAFGVKDFQISGGPGWLSTERYDITAKAGGGQSNVPQEDLKLMQQALLADRFQLKFHREQKEAQGYALVLAKGGPKLKEAAAGGNGQGGMMRMGRGNIDAQGVPMSTLVNMLGNQLGASIVDKTALTGNYDVRLDWTPEPGQGPAGIVHDGPAPASSDTAGPTIFTALQEQLGLKLESQKTMVDVIVIDSIARPSEN